MNFNQISHKLPKKISLAIFLNVDDFLLCQNFIFTQNILTKFIFQELNPAIHYIFFFFLAKKEKGCRFYRGYEVRDTFKICQDLFFLNIFQKIIKFILTAKVTKEMIEEKKIQKFTKCKTLILHAFE